MSGSFRSESRSPGRAISYSWRAIFRGCIIQGRKTAKGSKNRIEHRSHHHISMRRWANEPPQLIQPALCFCARRLCIGIMAGAIAALAHVQNMHSSNTVLLAKSKTCTPTRLRTLPPQCTLSFYMPHAHPLDLLTAMAFVSYGFVLARVRVWPCARASSLRFDGSP